MTDRRCRSLVALVLALAALASGGCITLTSRQTVFDNGGMKVVLRSDKRGTQTVDREFQHPLTIAPVRLAHILSRIDLDDDSSKHAKRRPAIPTEILYPIADALAKGLAAADPSQEVMLFCVRRTKRMAVFDTFLLTSLLAWARNDVLYIQVGRSDWEIPPRRRDQLPEPHPGEQEQGFRLIVDDGMSLVDAQTAAVDWHAQVFANPTRTRIMPSGKVKRTTILMESEKEEASAAATPTIPANLAPEQLRALADLEEARQAGTLSEAEYLARRTQILAGSDSAP